MKLSHNKSQWNWLLHACINSNFNLFVLLNPTFYLWQLNSMPNILEILLLKQFTQPFFHECFTWILHNLPSYFIILYPSWSHSSSSLTYYFHNYIYWKLFTIHFYESLLPSFIVQETKMKKSAKHVNFFKIGRFTWKF